MIKIDTHNIKSSDDFELNIKRKQLLTYHIAYNDTKKAEGIVFIIPGFGDDAAVSYQKNLIKHIADKYNFLAVFVQYHGLYSRVSGNKETAKYQFNASDTEILIKYIDMFGIELDEDNLDYQSIVEVVNKHIDELKSTNQLDKNFLLDMWGTIFPYNDEYQNFGVLQSIDILTVLYHIKSLGHDDIITNKPLVAIGSSHGGYLANLLMKFAPNTFDAIIDNSCYVKPPMNYIVGFETDPFKAEYYMLYSHIKMHFFTLTNWTLKQNNNQFNQASYDIRDLSNTDQINQLALQGLKTKVISYHSTFDNIANYPDKNNYITELKKHNIDCHLNKIHSKTQVDGKLIKNLNHSMGMSIKTLIDKELPNVINYVSKNTPTDISLQSTIRYDVSDNHAYIFDFNETAVMPKII